MNSEEKARATIDKVVELSDSDPELKDGIRYIDEQARKKGISFYDMMYEVFYKHEINQKAKKWVKEGD